MNLETIQLDKILVPIDGSKQAFEAAKRAVYIAGLNNAEVTLLCVVDLNKEVAAFEQVSLSGYVPAELKEGAYQLLAELMHEEIPREVRAKTFVEIGSPSEVIVEVAARENCDLIVMGRRGFGTFRGLVMGSVSQYVLHHAHCPVLIAHGQKKAAEEKI